MTQLCINLAGKRPTACTYHALAPIPTREGARHSCFSTELSQFYLAVPAHGGQPAEIRVFQTQ